MAVNPKTLDFSTLSQFLVGTAAILQPDQSVALHDRYIAACLLEGVGLDRLAFDL
jgi:hypothetical protein